MNTGVTGFPRGPISANGQLPGLLPATTVLLAKAVVSAPPKKQQKSEGSAASQKVVADMLKNPGAFGLNKREALDVWVTSRLASAKDPNYAYQIGYILQAMDASPELVKKMQALMAKNPNADFSQDPFISDLVNKAPPPGAQVLGKLGDAVSRMGLLASGLGALQGLQAAAAIAGNQLALPPIKAAFMQGMQTLKHPAKLAQALQKSAVGGAKAFWDETIGKNLSTLKTILWRSPAEYLEFVKSIGPGALQTVKDVRGLGADAVKAVGHLRSREVQKKVVETAVVVGKNIVTSDKTKVISYQAPSLAMNFALPKETGNKIVDAKALRDRNDRIAVAYLSILLGTTGVSLAKEPAGPVVNALYGNVSGATSAILAGKKEPADIAAFMLVSGISSKYAALGLLKLGGKAAESGAAVRFGVPAGLTSATVRDQTLSQITLTDFAQYMLSRPVTTVVANSVGQQVVNVQNTGKFGAINASQLLAAVTLTMVRNGAYFTSMTQSRGLRQKLTVYVATTALGILASAKVKSMFPSTPASKLTDQQRQKVMKEVEKDVAAHKPEFNKLVNDAVVQIERQLPKKAARS